MKKLVAVLLVILIVASCCAFAACQESCDKRGYHNYVSYKCKDCGATRCIEEDHKWIIGEDGKPVFTQCIYCNAADCDRGDHSCGTSSSSSTISYSFCLLVSLSRSILSASHLYYIIRHSEAAFLLVF